MAFQCQWYTDRPTLPTTALFAWGLQESIHELAQDLEGVTLGAYLVHYADGRQREFPITYGLDVRDCLVNTNEYPATNAMVAWSGSSPAARNFNLVQKLYKRTWENPEPDIQITSINFVSRPALAQPFLIAITIE